MHCSSSVLGYVSQSGGVSSSLLLARSSRSIYCGAILDKLICKTFHINKLYRQRFRLIEIYHNLGSGTDLYTATACRYLTLQGYTFVQVSLDVRCCRVLEMFLTMQVLEQISPRLSAIHACFMSFPFSASSGSKSASFVLNSKSNEGFINIKHG